MNTNPENTVQITVEFFDKLSGKVVYTLASHAFEKNTPRARCKLLNAAYKVGKINFSDPHIVHRFIA